jgi:hypothetical protein
MNKAKKQMLTTIFILLVFMGSSLSYAVLYIFPVEEQNVQWLARLNIYIDGNLVTIPAGIGLIEGQNTTGIHTYAENNVLYKEGPKNLTLENFFNSWGETFNSTCIMSYCSNDTYEIRMYVNGQPNYEFEKYSFNDKDLIDIDYSTI